MLKKSIFILSLLVFGLQAFSQPLKMDAPLPVDESVRKGVLPNGLTYYIKSTDVVQNAASYYIIQNVGSVLENDDQQGLAHFLEHMAFNGTKHFPGKGILNTLQKHGAIFGKDINAYTSFDETVYNLNNIPTSGGLVDTCLLVLNDWSNYLLLTEEEIDAERGVIKEEWRTRQSGQMRILQATLGTTFYNSKYADRLPIGLMSIVEGFEYKALRDFYHDWYRTDLQAIAIIGDIDADVIEKKVKKMFSKIPAVKNPRERFVVDIPGNEKLAFKMAMDKEVSTSSVSLNIRHANSLKDQTVADLKNDLLENLATTMLSARLREISQKPEASFLGARIGYRQMARTCNAFGVDVYPKPNQQHAAFAEVLTEVNRAVKFGFTQSEIDRTIAQFKNYYETSIGKKDDVSHGQIAQNIQNDYLNNITISDIEKEYELAQKIFAGLTAADVHNTMKRLYAKNNRTVTVTGVEGNNNLTEKDVNDILHKVENDGSITAYTEDFQGKTLVSGLNIKAGKITAEEKTEAIGSTTFTLSNGIKVHYKFSDKNKNSVNLNAVSYGGKSLIKNEDLPSTDLIGNLLGMSGLGDYNATELQKVMAGKTARVSPSIDETGESISGNSTTKDVETMLQLTHLYFEKPRFDEQSFQVLQSMISNYLIRRSNDIKEKMQDSVTVTLYGYDHPVKRIFNEDFVKDISFEKIKAVYNERFANPADFEFFIVGDVKEADLKPLLEKYIASLPTSKDMEEYKDNSNKWASSRVDKDIYMEMEDPKSTVRIAFKKEMKHSLKNEILARALGDMMQLRYTETLREQEGGTYGASSFVRIFKRPKSIAYASVSFDCNPDKVETLIDIVYKEIDKFKKGDINQTDLDKTLTNFIKERQQAKDDSSYDMNLLTNFFREGYNMDDPENFENIVNSITKKDIQNFAKAALDGAESFEIVFKPKK